MLPKKINASFTSCNISIHHSSSKTLIGVWGAFIYEISVKSSTGIPCNFVLKSHLNVIIFSSLKID